MISFAAIILASETRLLQRILGTIDLDFNQWIIALAVGSSILFVSEIYKVILRNRRAHLVEPTAVAQVVDVTAAA